MSVAAHDARACGPSGACARIEHMYESAEVRQAVAALHADVRAGAAAGHGAVGDWVHLVAEVQETVNALTAVQDLAIARVCASQTHYGEDGLLEERWTPLGGEQRLDAPDLLAPALSASSHAASARVEDAVCRVHTFPALGQAMAAGSLDGYRARVIAGELASTPAPVAREAAARVVEELRELRAHALADLEVAPEGLTRGRLVRRVAAAVLALDPALAVARQAEVARERAFTRWSERLGQDTWRVVLPSDRAASAFVAIDALARRLRAAGEAETLDQARADALVRLVLGQATVTYSVDLMVPAEALVTRAAMPAVGPAARAAAAVRAELVEVRGLAAQPVLATKVWLEEVFADPGTTMQVRPCAAGTGAVGDPAGDLDRDGYVPGERLARVIRARDGRCRFPGCSAAARWCDLDHVRPWPTGPTAAGNLILLCRRHHRIKQSPGWRLALRPDGSVVWVDPLRRRQVTTPVDQLDAHLTLSAGESGMPRAETSARTESRAAASSEVSESSGPLTVLEVRLEQCLEASTRPTRGLHPALARRSRQQTSLDLTFRTRHQVRLAQGFARMTATRVSGWDDLGDCPL